MGIREPSRVDVITVGTARDHFVQRREQTSAVPCQNSDREFSDKLRDDSEVGAIRMVRGVGENWEVRDCDLVQLAQPSRGLSAKERPRLFNEFTRHGGFNFSEGRQVVADNARRSVDVFARKCGVAPPICNKAHGLALLIMNGRIVEVLGLHWQS